MDLKLQWAISKIMERLHPNFYGSITLTFHGGQLDRLTTEESLKPEIDLKTALK